MTQPLTAAEKRQLVAWGRRAVHGLDESAVFVGVLGGGPLDAGRIEFTLQLGHALLTGKTIILPVPHGVEIPAKLAAAADRIVRYDSQNPETLQSALAQALAEMGINKQ